MAVHLVPSRPHITTSVFHTCSVHEQLIRGGNSNTHVLVRGIRCSCMGANAPSSSRLVGTTTPMAEVCNVVNWGSANDTETSRRGDGGLCKVRCIEHAVLGGGTPVTVETFKNERAQWDHPVGKRIRWVGRKSCSYVHPPSLPLDALHWFVRDIYWNLEHVLMIGATTAQQLPS